MLRRLTQSLAALLLLFGISQKAQAQSMSCASHTNISVDATCTTSVAVSAVSTAAPAGSVTKIFNGTNLIPQPLSSAYIGQILTVKVIAPNGNSCWGTIKLEDKAAPVLACVASPQNIPCSVQNLQVSTDVRVVFDNIPNNNIPDVAISGILNQPTVTENCGLYNLSYSDVVDDKDCSAVGLSAVVTRTWVASDAYNNSTSCVIQYNLQRLPITDVVFPTDKKLSCSATFTLDSKGNPAASVTGSPTLNSLAIFPTMAGFCEINASYHDVRVNTCGKTFEILRKWTVIDACTNTVKTQNQSIIVEDKTAPTFDLPCPMSDIVLPSNGDNCDLDNYSAPAVSVKDNCDAAPMVTTVVFKGATVVASGAVMSNIPLGTYTLQYTATDACGNQTTCTRNLIVKDLAPPVAVCDLNTKIALTSNGKALLPAIDIDDNSLDNCCLDVNRFEIKRVSDDDTAYQPVLELNCADKNLMVALRVWDCNNNSNVCMVNVLVEDKLPPVITAKDTSVLCGDNTKAEAWLNFNKPPKKTLLIDYPTASNPGYYDNCDATVSFTDSKNIDNCGNGTYTRTWLAKDAAGFTATTIQKYVSINQSSFIVDFPKDVLFNSTANCDKTETEPANTGKPIITTTGNTCPLVSVDYTDDRFDIGGANVCYKIIRTWKIMNWCNYNQSYVIQTVPSNPVGASVTVTVNDKGYLEYKQLIKVIDNTPPVVMFKPYKLEPVGKECKAKLTISKPDIKDCASETSSYYTITDKNNVIFAQSATFPGEYTFVAADFGKKFTIRYYASDKCGNVAVNEETVTIKDVKKPTPICHQDIAINMMPNGPKNGMAMLDAKVLDAGSYDNCTPPSKLTFKIQYPAPTPAAVANGTINVAGLPTMYSFTCGDTSIIPYNDQFGYLATVGLWVCDEAGNADYCETTINVQDNNQLCDYIPIQMKNLAGAIVTEKNKEVESVKLNLTGTKQQYELSNITGKYLFKDLPIKGKYTIVPERLDNPLNGVTTLDLVLMSKHILGTQPLTSAYQQIAGDINKNGVISTADIVELRKMILGIQPAFTKNNSWRFVDKNFVFDSNVEPLQQNFAEQKTLVGFNPANSTDFIAVKIGDINGSATTTNGTVSGRSEKPTTLIEVVQNNYQVGQEIRIPMMTESPIEGFQSSLTFDQSNLTLSAIEGEKNNFAVLENGLITIATEKNNPITLVFKAKNNLRLSENLHLSSQVTENEAFDKKGNTYSVIFNFNQNETPQSVELYQNRPNPFSNETLISFSLPQAGRAKLTISDVSGRVIKTIEEDFSKGYNELKINKSDIATNGVLYLQLEQNGLRATKKMISVE
jgi:hypothetical protein